MLKQHTPRQRTAQGYIPSLPSQDQHLKLMSYGRLALSLLLILLVIYALVTNNPWQLPIFALLQIGITMIFISVILYYAERRDYSLNKLIRFSLVMDTILLTELIYFTGGAANPVTVLYILPIINAALFCTPRFSRFLTLTIILCYLLLFFYYWPLSLFEHDMSQYGMAQEHGAHAHESHTMSATDNSMLLHLIGMWVTFSLSAFLAMIWISNLVQTVRRHELKLQEAYQRQQEDEYWLTMGMQTATLAHELSTPLNNLELIYEELHNHPDLPHSAKQDVVLMATQLEQSKASLARFRQFTPPQEKRIFLYQELWERLLRWRNLRPDAHCYWERSSDDVKDYEVLLHDGFWYAFFNILNNAADAGEQTIELHTELSEDNKLLMTIYNRDGHLSQQQLSKAGLNIIESDKPFGLGLGVRLAHASLSRLGGSLELSNHSEGGVIATISLPLLVLSELRE